MRRINLCDGKYTIINDLDNGGEFKALRYGEEWRNLTGDKLVLALFEELEKARDEAEYWQKQYFALCERTADIDNKVKQQEKGNVN